jgi:hypothetical protein
MSRTRHDRALWRTLALAAAILLAGVAMPAAAQRSAPSTAPAPTYADLADLVEAAAIVALVEVRKQAEVESERAPGLAPGHARLYVEARTEALLASRSALGESLVYLADVPLDAKGKVPKLRKQRFIVFADPVAGRPGSLQLVDPWAQLPASPATEQLARTVIAALAAPDVPPAVTGIRDIMSVPGNLAGESETQLFLDTVSGEPVSLSVVRRPGMDPAWGVSWSEIVDQSARPPEPQTVAWYRLACSLPTRLPNDAFLQQDQASRRRAESDYAFIVEQLGACPRTRM